MGRAEASRNFTMPESTAVSPCLPTNIPRFLQKVIPHKIMKQNLEQPIFYAVQHLSETKTQEVKFSYIVDTKHMLIS